jgi:von willebrand factor type A domain
MLKNLRSVLTKGFLLGLLGLTLPCVGWADTLQVKKDVFLIDVSRSMQGYGSVSTPNVFDDVKRELSSAFGKAKQSKAVLIPFSDKVRGSLSVELPQDSSIISSYVERLSTADGRTDIYNAWKVALDSLNSDASGSRLYLITDALHNSRKYSLDSLRALLSLWKGEKKDAYLVLLNPEFESSELADAFRANERMYVINSLQDLYRQAEVDTTQTVIPPALVSDSTASSEGNSLWWLWILLVALAVGGIIYVVLKLGLWGSDSDVDTETEGGVALAHAERQASEGKNQNVIDKAVRYFNTCPSDGNVEDDYDRVPAKEENKEGRTIRELMDDPYNETNSLFEAGISRYKFSEESKDLMRADIKESRDRIFKNPLKKLRRVNREPDFFPYRLGNVAVPSVTAAELVRAGLVNSRMSDDEIDAVIRAENYRRLGVAFDRRWKLPEGTSQKIFGALLHCTPHEDKSGFVFLVRIPLHKAIPHSGAASQVTKQVRVLLAEKSEG